MDKLGLREIITDKHGEEGPGTTRSNKIKNAIDGILGSTGLYTTSCRYLLVHYTITLNHILIWVKISLSYALGDKNLLSTAPSAQKLRHHHPSGKKTHLKNETPN